MAMQIDRFYDSIADLVPPDFRAKLAQSRDEVTRHINQEVDAFATELTSFIAKQLDQAEKALAVDLAQRRAAMEQLVQQLAKQVGDAQAPAAETARRLQEAQTAYEEQWRQYGRTLRQTMVEGFKAAGLPIPGLGLVAGLFEDRKPM